MVKTTENKIRKEKQILINESDWKKIKVLVNKIDDKVDILDKADFGIKIYDDLTDLSAKLGSKVYEVDRERQEAKVKLGEIYEKGFKNGIGFCNDILGKFGDMISDNISWGNLPRNFDWDKQVEKEIKRDIKDIK